MTRIVSITFLLFFFLASTPALFAQETDWRTYIEQLAEEEDMNQTLIENLFEELSQLENNPLNLNTVSREQLEMFPLLSAEQATGMADFLEKNRPIATVFELRNIPLLDLKTVQLILPFFYVGETESKKEKIGLKQLRNYGRNEIQLHIDKTLTQRAGYREYPDEILEKYPNRKYAGEDFYTSLRYTYRYKNNIQFGLTGEKDAGEPFLKSGYRKGFDHYGFHFIVKDIGIVKILALGDYRLSFGQGLVLNNDFVAPKAWAMNNIVRRTQQPKRHFSTAESGFFRGAAVVVALSENVTATVFYSDKHIDANLSSDDHITSFKTDGYHRTPLEIRKKRNVRERVSGANVNFRKNRLQVGAGAVYYGYSKMYNPALRGYNTYSMRGTEYGNAGVDYSYRFSRIVFAGETAIDKNGAVATLNAVHYYPSSEFSLSALYRHYPISYNALYANAFSVGGGIRNEKGLFLGASFSPLRRLSVSTYIDLVRFPWIKYNVDTPSHTIDYYFAGTYNFSRSSDVELRYTFRQKEKNIRLPDEKAASVLPYDTHKLRLRYKHSAKSGWSFNTTADGTYYKESHLPKQFGYMISQHIGYRGSKKISGDGYVGYFNSHSYNTRLYSYERNIFNTFYMPSFYGKGMRLAFSAKYDIAPNLSFSVKAGYTRYFNRNVIGSDTEQIDGNSRTDIFTYLRWKF